MAENLNSMSVEALELVEQAIEKLMFLYFEDVSGEKYQETFEVLEGLALVSLDDETSIAVLDQLAAEATDIDSGERSGGTIPSATIESGDNLTHFYIAPCEPRPTPPDVSPEWSNTKYGAIDVPKLPILTFREDYSMYQNETDNRLPSGGYDGGLEIALYGVPQPDKWRETEEKILRAQDKARDHEDRIFSSSSFYEPVWHLFSCRF